MTRRRQNVMTGQEATQVGTEAPTPMGDLELTMRIKNMVDMLAASMTMAKERNIEVTFNLGFKPDKPNTYEVIQFAAKKVLSETRATP